MFLSERSDQQINEETAVAARGRAMLLGICCSCGNPSIQKGDDDSTFSIISFANKETKRKIFSVRHSKWVHHRMPPSPTSIGNDMTVKRAADGASEGAEGVKRPKQARSGGEGSLGTLVNARKVNFDREPVCEVTCSRNRVYCCLQCGMYLQGRGAKSPAFLHAIEDRGAKQHWLFVHLATGKLHLLPENRAVTGEGLGWIRDNIDPVYCSLEEVQRFPQQCHDIVGSKPYYNGFVALNNTSSGSGTTQWNCIVMLLAHVEPLRNHLLRSTGGGPLGGLVSLLVRKIWWPRLLRRHVSIEQLTNHVGVHHGTVNAKLTSPRLVFLWLVQMLSRERGGAGDPLLPCVLNDSLRGQLKSHSDKSTPFYILTLSLPAVSPYRDGREVNALEQVELGDLLAQRNQSEFIRMPRYLVLYYNRLDAQETRFPLRNRNRTIVKYSPGGVVIGGCEYELVCNVDNNVVKSDDVLKDDDSCHWDITVRNQKFAQWVEIDGVRASVKEEELLFLKEVYMQVWVRKG